MDIVVDHIDEYLGKPVSDPYGRRLGFIIGFYSDSDGRVRSLEVNLGDVEFKQIDIARFRFENGEVVLLPEWEYQALQLENRILRLKKRMAALEELNARKDLPKHAYDTFKKSLEEELAKVKEDTKNVKDLLRKRMHELEDMIVELEKAMTSVKISYLSGEIPEKAYKAAVEQIRKHLDSCETEKESVKKHLDKIEALEAQPVELAPKIVAPSQAQPAAQPANQPLSVIVVEG
ncbi:CdvA-like protein [Thermogladius sp. 4427co]|uniref:CdvA-like protein n=1 Tax=Thermogladius sp. 4427co TaxID=3450718 RepID=UPI003F794461